MTPSFSYRQGELHAEQVPVRAVAQSVGTPFYLYSDAALAAAYGEFAQAFAGRPATVCYSLKANSNLAVVASFGALGAGADVVSEGELHRALKAGIAPEKIVFAGVGKAPGEMAAGLAAGILQFNVESLPELRALSAVAQASGRRAPVALRINPDVDPRTHAKIATGLAETKFGIAMDQARAAFAEAAVLPGIELVGIAVHIGSQLTDLEPFRAAFQRVAELAAGLRADGIALKRLDLGGGLGVAYGGEQPPSLKAYAALIEGIFSPHQYALILEPGRRLVAEAGLLVASVLYLKEGDSRRFVILDAGMNDLLRPALYDAYHAILPVREPEPGAPLLPADIVGPVCETADIFAAQRPVPPLQGGDLVAFATAGAYGAVMASGYNSRLPPPEVMVRGHDWRIVRPRPTYDMMIEQDRVPDWLPARPMALQRGAA